MAAFVGLHEGRRGALGHLPGLDGLRGLAVAGVVAFHAGFGGMAGGYLGVSTFFTLSGFLIASLLFARATRQEGIVLRGFWGRRFRRLFPASVVTLILVLALFAPTVATPDQLASLRGDSLAALFNVANWWFILEGSSYGELFTAPSPLLHFWSLAIEEQFYLVFPVVLWAIVRIGGARRVVVGGALAALATASLAWAALGGLSVDRIYFGTGTRASELLLGAVLAVVLTHGGLRRRLAAPGPARTVVLALGAGALAVQLWWWWGLEQSSAWLYRGGFTLYAALTCLVILAAAIPVGPVFAALRVAPLRWLGARSYAVYLVHWPLFLAARQTWGDADRWVLTAGVVAASLLLAELSFRVLERPIRLGARLPEPRRALVAMGASAAAVVVLAFTVVPDDPAGTGPDFDADLEEFQDRLAAESDDRPATDSAAPGAEDADAPPPVPAVAVYGDSTALAMGMGLATWGQETGRLGAVLGDLRFGCGVARYEEFRADFTLSFDEECRAWPERWATVIEATSPDVVLVSSPAWAVPDARIPGASDFSAIGDPAVDDFVRSELLAAVDILSARGALVLLVNWPEYGSWYDDGRPDAVADQADPRRMARLHEIQREVAALRAGKVGVVELAEWAGPRAQDPALRSDGIHFTPEEFLEVAEEWFGPEVERQWQQRWNDFVKLDRARGSGEVAQPGGGGGP
jgi:peptidoglycan/LPS O-acetylase OafA/YrhL